MKLFECQSCGQAVYFENTQCTQCGATLGYLPDIARISALEGQDAEGWRSLDPAAPQSSYRKCRNYLDENVCNWMVPAAEPDELCMACRLNRTIPNLAEPAHKVLWARLETNKRHMVYSLLRLGLPLVSKQQDPEGGLAFDFLADPDPQFREEPGVMTGHAEGLITINVAEADNAAREQMRENMGEPYRTLLGHFRHEVGHYYWERLVRHTDALEPFRALFGDEQQDYGQALDHHYQDGPPADWQERFVSAYASAHPWEDWAETWAHYLHMVDTLETAVAFGVRVEPRVADREGLTTRPTFDPYDTESFEQLVEHWIPLTFALNSLNRSMGQPDAYPFVLAPPALDKLAFVHGVIREAARERVG